MIADAMFLLVTHLRGVVALQPGRRRGTGSFPPRMAPSTNVAAVEDGTSNRGTTRFPRRGILDGIMPGVSQSKFMQELRCTLHAILPLQRTMKAHGATMRTTITKILLLSTTTIGGSTPPMNGATRTTPDTTGTTARRLAIPIIAIRGLQTTELGRIIHSHSEFCNVVLEDISKFIEIKYG